MLTRSEFHKMRSDDHSKLFKLCFPNEKYDEDRELPENVVSSYWKFRGNLLSLDPNAGLTDEALVTAFMLSGRATHVPEEAGILDAVMDGRLKSGGSVAYVWQGKNRNGRYAGLKGTSEVEVIDGETGENRVVKIENAKYTAA